MVVQHVENQILTEVTGDVDRGAEPRATKKSAAGKTRKQD